MTDPALCRTCANCGESGNVEDYRPFCRHFNDYTYNAIGACWAECRKRKDGHPFKAKEPK